jgi:hypothetical protein
MGPNWPPFQPLLGIWAFHSMNLNIQYVWVCCIVPQLEHNQKGKSHLL